MLCEVLRSFPGPGGVRLQAGETVDTTNWRNAERLIDQRFLIVKSRKKKAEDDVKTAKAASTKGLTVAKTARKRRIL